MCPQCWQEQQYSRLQLATRLEGLWEQIQKARRSYTEATEKKKVEFEELKKKCVKSSWEIDVQAKKLQKLQVLAGRWVVVGVGSPAFPAHFPWGHETVEFRKASETIKSNPALAKG